MERLQGLDVFTDYLIYKTPIKEYTSKWKLVETHS
jgi:hypothetical protein